MTTSKNATATNDSGATPSGASAQAADAARTSPLAHLTAADFASADSSHLYNVLHWASSEIARRNNKDALDGIASYLAEEGITTVAAVEFGTLDYGNGYHYTAEEVTFIGPDGTALPDSEFEKFVEDYHDDLDEIATELSSDEQPGSRSAVRIDLNARTVTHT